MNRQKNITIGFEFGRSKEARNQFVSKKAIFLSICKVKSRFK